LSPLAPQPAKSSTPQKLIETKSKAFMIEFILLGSVWSEVAPVSV
jgi:hypothetical protein